MNTCGICACYALIDTKIGKGMIIKFAGLHYNQTNFRVENNISIQKEGFFHRISIFLLCGRARLKLEKENVYFKLSTDHNLLKLVLSFDLPKTIA